MLAGVRSVDLERLLDHLVGTEESPRPLEPRPPHPISTFGIFQQLRDGARELAMVAWGNQDAGLTIRDGFRDPPGIGRDDWLRQRHRVEQRRAQTLP